MVNDEGVEIEVVSAADAKAQAEAATATAIAATRAEEEAKWKPKVSTLESELGEANTALKARAGEFAQFRKLSDEAVAKLDIAQRTIYENGLALEDERQKNKTADEARRKTEVENSLRATAGTDEKLFDKMKSMWDLVGINAVTPEEIEHKKKMILGAIANTEPNLVASVAGFSGSFKPPVTQRQEGQSFADTDAGKSLAKDIGLVIPEPKK